ncbi:class I SAM-dependent methyltransferase [Fulvimarina sp. MAC3]|uniref:class I SAM-dependent methyltransferase n=1 Tax=Fulvimarina sp. MAC3 TaxID=3148887 RepID=UPI0031FBC08E
MSDWGQGYITDVGYTRTHFRELTPRYLALTALLQGFRPPDPDRPFRYLELGCGRALSLITAAASHPDSTFLGIDFNPEHVASARRLIEAAGLDNVEVRETDFESFSADTARHEPFDFVALHGVFSWVSASNRDHIVSILSKFVAPGGLVFLSYNAMPGWAPLMPLQRLLRAKAEEARGRSDQRIGEAIEFARQLSEAKAGYFAAHEGFSAHLKRIGSQDVRYLAHEYLNQSWTPHAFPDVADALAPAKLGYVGSTLFSNNVDRFVMSGELQTLLAAISDWRLKEYVRDLITNTVFRRDVWGRGAERISPDERLRHLSRTQFTAIADFPQPPTAFSIPVGEIRYSEEMARNVWTTLRGGPKSVDEIGRSVAFTQENWLDYLTLLVHSGRAHPCRRAETVTDDLTARTRRLNAALLDETPKPVETAFLASPLLSGALPIDPVDQLLYRSWRERPGESEAAFARHLADAIADHVLTVLPEGGSLDQLTGSRANTGAVAARLDLWRRLGIEP